jgi:hypothetical protein
LVSTNSDFATKASPDISASKKKLTKVSLQVATQVKGCMVTQMKLEPMEAIMCIPNGLYNRLCNNLWLYSKHRELWVTYHLGKHAVKLTRHRVESSGEGSLSLAAGNL